MTTSLGVTVLDGGMGRELERMGAPFRQPEWSALALMEAPDTVLAAHRSFIASGAQIVTTNSYALVPFHIGEERFVRDGARLAALAGKLARQAADEEVERTGRVIRVAGSLPPMFGSYQPELFDAARAPVMLDRLVQALLPHVDLFLAETQSCIAEALAACAAVAPTGRPIWVSFTLQDDEINRTEARLRSGEAVADAIAAVRQAGAQAVLFNCSRPEVMGPAVDIAAQVLGGSDIAIGVYANAFPEKTGEAAANEGISALREDVAPQRYLGWAQDWRRRGARIIGGCCGIGPDYICAIHKGLKAE
ncbi:homocysteine S-methyltransferase family protein [Bosea psychrotolerans]|uniref:Homocysteine S-methyltransferase n=1 Tax=Bosea psychrotolerans TaxID=1871628 RepID=A0A2S4M3P0_9HYPH|nr:homocysteine S-methyltransferase family protein [Bosea psychrotolerans]POR49314.1 homocysteine S-methyltransferase [Bosea psychrotolerans]